MNKQFLEWLEARDLPIPDEPKPGVGLPQYFPTYFGGSKKLRDAAEAFGLKTEAQLGVILAQAPAACFDFLRECYDGDSPKGEVIYAFRMLAAQAVRGGAISQNWEADCGDEARRRLTVLLSPELDRWVRKCAHESRLQISDVVAGLLESAMAKATPASSTDEPKTLRAAKELR